METKIIRTDDIVVQSATVNDYGDLLVIDKGGGQHKIGKKRSQLFNVFQPNQAVHLSYSEYMNKEYIADATPVGQMIDQKASAIPTPPSQQAPEKSFVSGQEVGLWWKELGNRIGDGSLERDFPKSHVAIKSQYYKKMAEITGVVFKES